MNVIRRGLGAARVAAVSARAARRASPGRSPTATAIDRPDRRPKIAAKKPCQTRRLSITTSNLYANDDTAAMADDAKRAIDVLFARARAAGLLAVDVAVDWAP